MDKINLLDVIFTKTFNDLFHYETYQIILFKKLSVL